MSLKSATSKWQVCLRLQGREHSVKDALTYITSSSAAGDKQRPTLFGSRNCRHYKNKNALMYLLVKNLCTVRPNCTCLRTKSFSKLKDDISKHENLSSRISTTKRHGQHWICLTNSRCFTLICTPYKSLRTISYCFKLSNAPESLLSYILQQTLYELIRCSSNRLIHILAVNFYLYSLVHILSQRVQRSTAVCTYCFNST